MDVALSRRIGLAFQHESTPSEQHDIVEEAALVERWEQLPEDIQDLIITIEERPYTDGWPGGPAA